MNIVILITTLMGIITLAYAIVVAFNARIDAEQDLDAFDYVSKVNNQVNEIVGIPELLPTPFPCGRFLMMKGGKQEIFDHCPYCRTAQKPIKGLYDIYVCSCCGAEV